MLIVALVALVTLIVALIIRDQRRVAMTPIVLPARMSNPPAVSVIVPARNEARRIDPLLQGLARQTTSQWELILVDDHSADGTSEIVERRRADFPELRIWRAAPLPEEWSGKCWACWQGAELSRRPWLLFLDADTAPAPELLESLLARAQAANLDLLSLLPLVELGSFAERLLLPPFTALIQVVFPPALVNDPASPVAMANGPCILVRRDAYFATGGHSAVRGSILEDVDLARLLKDQGYRIELAQAPILLRVRLYSSFSEIVEGLSKNAEAGFRAGGRRSRWGGLHLAVLALAPLLTLLAGSVGLLLDASFAAPLLWCGGVCYVLAAVSWGAQVYRSHHVNPLWGLLFAWGVLGYFVLAGYAWARVRRGDRLSWKERTYRS